MAEEYIVEVGIENEEELKKLQEQVAVTAKTVESLSESVKKLAESQKVLVEKLNSTTRATQESVTATKDATKANKQYVSSSSALKKALIVVASAAGLVTAAIHSKRISLSLANKLYDIYARTAQRAAKAVVSFASEHKILGAMLTQTIRALSVTTGAWIAWAKGASASAVAVRLSLGAIRSAIATVFTELQKSSPALFGNLVRGFEFVSGTAQRVRSTLTSLFTSLISVSRNTFATLTSSFEKVSSVARASFEGFLGVFNRILIQVHRFSTIGKVAFTSLTSFITKAASALKAAFAPAISFIVSSLSKLGPALLPLKGVFASLFEKLKLPAVVSSFEKLVGILSRVKVAVSEIASIVTTKLVSSFQSLGPLWTRSIQLAEALRQKVIQIGAAVATKLAGKKIGLTSGLAFLGVVLDRIRDKILQLGSHINKSLGGEAASIGARLAKPFVAMIGSLTILSGKFLKIFPLTKKFGSTLTTLGFSLASVSSFSRSWSMTMSHLDKVLPGTSERLQKVSRGFSDLTKNINLQTSALPKLLSALSKVGMHYFLVFKMNVGLAHAFEAIGERISQVGEATLEHFGEVYKVSSEMIRTQVDLNRAVRRYVELTGDASMSAKDWMQWSDKLALSTGKNVSEMRRVTGALLDFAGLYKLNQKETKRFIALMADVSTFLGKDVFEALQNVHGALAGMPRSAQILGINIDHLREKTKFYEDQLRKEGTETGKSVKQKARMLALIQELSYLQGVNNRLMSTGYGILKRYRVSQELLAAQTGNYVSPILNAYYKILTQINEVMAMPSILGFTTTLKAAGGAALDLTGRLIKLAGKIFILIEVVTLAEKAMTALNASFDVFGMTQRTALAPMFVMRDGMIKTNVTAASLGKTIRNIGSYIGTKLVNFFKEGAKAAKGFAVEMKAALATLFAAKIPRTLFGPSLFETMAPEKGVVKKALAASKLMQASFLAEGLILSKKAAPMVQKHAKQVRDAFLITKDMAGAQREWANTIIGFSSVTSRSAKVWYTFLGIFSKVKGVVLKVTGLFKGFVKVFGLILLIVPAVYKAIKDALAPAFKAAFGDTQAFQTAVTALGEALGWVGKVIGWIVSGPVKLLATGIAGTVGAISYAIGMIIKYRGVLLRLTGPLYLLGKSVFSVGKWFGIWGKSVDSLNKKLDSASETLIKFGERSTDNARAIIGMNKLLEKHTDRIAKLRKELAETMKKRLEELGLNLASAKSLEGVVNAIQAYQEAYHEFIKVQDEIRRGRTLEGRQLKDEEALNRKSTEAVQELEKARRALAEGLKKQFEITGSQIKETKSLVSLYSKYTRAMDDISSGQEATLKTSQAITRIWQGLNQVTQGNLEGIGTTAEGYRSLAEELRNMATKASPSLRAALIAEAKSYEKQAEILDDVSKKVEGKTVVDEKLMETSYKVAAAQHEVNSELKRHQEILRNLQTSVTDTTAGLAQFASVYSKDVTVSAETAARVQLALAKISEVGARRYEEAINGNVEALKVYRNYLETIQKSQDDDLTSVIKDTEGRKLLNEFLKKQMQTVDNLIASYESETQAHETLNTRIKARLAALKAQNKVTTETLKLRKLLLDQWKSEFTLHARLNELTLQGLSTRQKRAQAERYLSEALQQSIEQYKGMGFTLKAFDDYGKGNISTVTAIRQALVQLQGRSDALSKAIRETLMSALSQSISRQREYAASTIQSARRIKELEKVIHPVYTTFGNYSDLITELVTRSQELAKQTGISSLAFDSTSVTVSDLASYLALLSAHQLDYNNVTKETAQDVTALGQKLLSLIKVNVSQWGADLANVFESLQGKTKDLISANDYLRPALLNTIFGFKGLVDKSSELDANLTPVMQNVLDSATAMYKAKDSTSAYGESLSNITALEGKVRDALNAALPQLNAQVQALAEGKTQTAAAITKTQDYSKIISILVSQLNTLTDAEERLRESRRRNLELSSSLVFSTEQMQKNVSELANVAVQDLIKQYSRAGIVLSESQKSALEEITKTITGHSKLLDLAQNRVDTFTKYIDAKLFEQTQAWTRNKDEIQAFADGLKTVGESAAQGILKNYAEIGAKIEEMGGFFGALGQMTQETVAQTAVGAFEELNKAIIDSVVYGKQFQLNWQDILRSFTAGLAQAMLKLLEFKLAMAAMQAMGFSMPGVGAGGGLFSIFKGQTGGPVPGEGRGDKVPAMLEPGEYVVPRPVVSKIGVEFFDALRKGISIPAPTLPRHYQEGGFVTPTQQPQEQKLTVVTIFDEKELNKYYGSPAYGRVVANNVGERIARRTS